MPRHLSILVVDDDSRCLESIDEVLSPQGHHVTTINDGTSIVDLLHNSTFELTILDIHMPKMDGFEVFQVITQINQQLPCIFMTGSKDRELKSRALDLGAFTLLHKPLDISVLRQTVDRVIQSIYD